MRDRIHHKNIDQLNDAIKNYIHDPREVIFLCIGTDRSTGDSLGPVIGTILKKNGMNVYGTIDNPVHAENLDETIYEINEIKGDRKIVAIDACLGKSESVGYFIIKDEPLRPGSGVGKNLSLVGNVSIAGVVNVGGFMEYLVLQNTRLNTIVNMANAISKAILHIGVNSNEYKELLEA